MNMIRNLETVYRYLTHSSKAGMPSVAYLMVTNKCNLRCKMCSYWKGIYESEMDTSDVAIVLDKLSEAGITILSITGGEPLMRKDISLIMDYAKYDAEIPYVRLQTNGTLFDYKTICTSVLCLDDIWISIDGIGKVHDFIRGVDGTFARVEKNVQLLNERRSEHTNLIINMVVNKYNKSQIECVRKLAERWNAQYVFFHDVVNVKDDAYHTRQFSSEEDIGEVYYPNRKGCLILYTNIMINPEGNVIPCGILDKLVVGNLLKQELDEIWNGDEMQKVRRMVWNGLEPCKQCCVPNTTLRSRMKDYWNIGRIL